MSSPEKLLSGLAHKENPSKEAKNRMKMRMMNRIDSPVLKGLQASIRPSRQTAASIRDRVLSRIKLPDSVRIFPSLKSHIKLSKAEMMELKSILMDRLVPVRQPLYPSILKWSAAFAVFLLLVRLMPFAFMPSVSRADSAVQLLPQSGDVSMFVGGIWVPVSEPYDITSPMLIRTGEDGSATVVLHDDGVFRLGPNTTIRLQDLSDRPTPAPDTPTVTFVRGTLWMLGLLPPTLRSIVVELPSGDEVSLNEGSVSISDDGNLAVAVFDKRAVVLHNKEEAFLLDGEMVRPERSLIVFPIPRADLDSSWTKDNSTFDSVHRAGVLQHEQERREELAGILPNSFFYPIKRVAEEVDVLFTVGNDARAQKRVDQADTRLNEALALLDQGDPAQASGSLLEYRESLLALTAGTGDNLVKFLVKKQLDEAAASVGTVAPEDDRYAIKTSILEVSAAVPDADLKPEDIEGYVLVDKLGALDRALGPTGSREQAIDIYDDIKPYIGELLSDDKDVHPLLKKEATALLVNTSERLEKLTTGSGATNEEFQTIAKELKPYLPAEPAQVLLSEEELDARVKAMVSRIFVFRTPISRYNQLMLELRTLEKDPNRGTLLRRLYHALPPNGLAIDVQAEIKELGDELKK